MKKRDIGILVGLGIIVLAVAWYFLVISPKREKVSELDSQVSAEKQKYEKDIARVREIDKKREAARRATGELLKINKLVPVDEQVPSLIIELQQSANEAGIDFMKIEPDVAVTVAGATVIPIELKFEGKFFDLNDFLYRVENYARIEGTDVNASGRLVSLVSFEVVEGEFETFPTISATLNINAYMTEPAPVKNAGRASGSGTSEGGESGGEPAAAGGGGQ